MSAADVRIVREALGFLCDCGTETYRTADEPLAALARLEGFASSEARSTERTFTESQVIQIVGYLTAELDALHQVEAPVVLEAAQKAMKAVQPTAEAPASEAEPG